VNTWVSLFLNVLATVRSIVSVGYSGSLSHILDVMFVINHGFLVK